MDFSLNDVQMMLDDSVGKFITNDYDFEARQKHAESDRGYNADTWQQFAELGWTAVPFSEAEGGLDGGAIELIIMMQHFGRGLVIEPYLANIVLAGGILRRTGTEAQKERWLHRSSRASCRRRWHSLSRKLATTSPMLRRRRPPTVTAGSSTAPRVSCSMAATPSC